MAGRELQRYTNSRGDSVSRPTWDDVARLVGLLAPRGGRGSRRGSRGGRARGGRASRALPYDVAPGVLDALHAVAPTLAPSGGSGFTGLGGVTGRTPRVIEVMLQATGAAGEQVMRAVASGGGVLAGLGDNVVWVGVVVTIDNQLFRDVPGYFRFKAERFSNATHAVSNTPAGIKADPGAIQVDMSSGASRFEIAVPSSVPANTGANWVTDGHLPALYFLSVVGRQPPGVVDASIIANIKIDFLFAV